MSDAFFVEVDEDGEEVEYIKPGYDENGVWCGLDEEEIEVAEEDFDLDEDIFLGCEDE